MSDKVCYSNNGLSMRYVEPSYEAQSGEALYDDLQDNEALNAAFPGRQSILDANSSVSSAKSLLDKADTVMLRIAEAIALNENTWESSDVVAWVNYRRSLRAIISNNGGDIPVKPSYPAGT